MSRPTSKICCRCKEEKPLSDFNRKGEGNRFHSYCKLCHVKYKKEWRSKNSDKASLTNKAWKLKKYDLTIREYDELFEKQHRRCAICKIHQSKLKQDLSVDHDHVTGRVRGLLCKRCNSAIGFLCDSSELCLEASHYLQINTKERKKDDEF